MTCPTW